jgi:hypothetical protein
MNSAFYPTLRRWLVVTAEVGSRYKNKISTNLQVFLQDDMSAGHSVQNVLSLVKEKHRLTHRMAILTNFTAQFVVL